jgi:hypothetical protein
MFFSILVTVGIVTIFGVLILGALEARRMENKQPDIITSAFKNKDDKSQQKPADTLRV